MSDTDDFYARVVSRLRSWGIDVEVLDNAVGRSNGLGNYANGLPDGFGRHHFVCSLKPDTGYIRSLVMMLSNGYGETPGPVVNWFGDVFGKLWLIATRPANHFGRGDTNVLAQLRAGQPVTGPFGQNDITGNGYVDGLELQHPGDGTPWPADLLKGAVALSAAQVIESGKNVHSVLQHWQWTDRKQDMSYHGGPSNRQSADDFKGLVSDWITTHTQINPPTPPEDDEAMAFISNQDEFTAALKKALGDIKVSHAKVTDQGVESPVTEDLLTIAGGVASNTERIDFTVRSGGQVPHSGAAK